MGRTPIFEIISGHHGDDDVGEPKLFYRSGHPFRFILFWGLWGLGEVDIAKAATSGALFAHDEKGKSRPLSEVIAGKGAANLFDPDGQFLKKVTYVNGRPDL